VASSKQTSSGGRSRRATKASKASFPAATTRKATGQAAELGRKGQSTRKMLNKVILDLVNERGYTNFRLKDLCERSGLTIGAFYFHYESKEHALREVAADTARELFANITSDIDAKPLEEGFRLTIRDFQRCYSDPHLQGAAKMMRAMIPADSYVTDVYFAEREKVIDNLVDAAGQERQSVGKRRGPERAVIEYLFCGLADFMEMVHLEGNDELKRSAGSPETIARRLGALWYQAVINA
jgi:AcrR family transcriptional regulator